MGFAEQLQVLQAAQNDPALLALALVDLAHHSLPTLERDRIKGALLAVAVPHWCDGRFLAALLDITPGESDRLLGRLAVLTIVERFPARGEEAVSVHDEARVPLRRYLQRTDPAHWRALVSRACAYVSTASEDYARVEAVFHKFALDQQSAAAECLALDLEFDTKKANDSRRMLVMNLVELIDCGRSPGSIGSRDASANATHAQSVSATFVPAPVRRPAKKREFDVFLCHNSQDKMEVEAIGTELRKRNLQPWLDKWELRPGKPWQQLLENQIETIQAAAVFVGSSGFGPWQDAEIRAFLRQFQERDCPVIPVILTTVSTVPRLPPFLAGMTWVDFRDADSRPMSMLIWGITGERPDDLP